MKSATNLVAAIEEDLTDELLSVFWWHLRGHDLTTLSMMDVNRAYLKTCRRFKTRGRINV